MRGDSGQTRSPWFASEETPARPPLAGDTRADVCVIGAGIAGMSAAYLLACEGRSVVVVEDGPIGGGQTGRTTAHLSNAIDDLYQTISKIHGVEGSRLAAESHTSAIDRIETIAGTEGIQCDFERLDGYLFTPPGAATDILVHELDAAHAAGLPDVELVPRAPLENFNTGPALRFPRQAQFHSLKYLTGLTAAIERRSGRIYCGTHAEEVTGGTPARVTTPHGTVQCEAVIVATNTPIVSRVLIHARQAAYLTYVVGALLPAGAVPRALYWDTDDPYHYMRLHTVPARAVGGDDGAPVDVLIVGGEDHRVGQADDAEARWGRLEAWTRERVPGIGPIAFRWSGEVMEPVDRLALIGRNPNDAGNVFIATGDTGMGMTHGTIAGILLTDLVVGRDNPWQGLYDPSRVRPRAVSTFINDAANMAAQYADWLTPGDVAAVEAIAPGSGAVMRHGLTKAAVYRDEDGAVHARSAVCPHLGCIVDWNDAERTWDCPCHGSRFDCHGRVINGPANRDLGEVQAPEQRRAS
jgi:glycine/D-amino acid oxidase-like deaminating enzyme/nitrite reductase/ring-hydroxylating ferredoxin subunit